ncbi:hypothetical protein [Neisseria sp.]|uniref:hypothetical protein n=1 Tax=Neisseria sp. TaxID=192066 RepID=UPI0028A27D05|nr:hypothetical protein [Neisseria sp.]
MSLLAYGLLILTWISITAFLTQRAHARNLALAQVKNLKWYRLHYPETVKCSCVQCYRCKNSEILVRQTRHDDSVEEHFCSQCGTILYYSSLDDA